MTFKLITSGRRHWAGLLGAVIAFVACVVFGGSVVKSAAVACAFICVSLLKVTIEDKFTCPVLILELLVSGFVSLFLSQFVLGEGLVSVRPVCVLLGYCCCLCVIGLIYFVIPSIRVAGALGIGVVFLLSIINFYVYSFRGTEFTFVDILSVATAVNVASQYHYQPSSQIVYGWVIYVLYIYSLWAIESKPVSWNSSRHFAICLPAVCAALLFGGLSGQAEVYHFGNHGTYDNGYFLNFCLTIDEAFIKKPDQYLPESVDRIAQTYVESDINNDQELPDIIVIMDEAYSDLSVLGSEVRTNAEITPFINSLMENTIKGYALTSAFGGRTANSEFEFLTGTTMGFLPSGSIAYQQFAYEGQYSIITHLESLGYETAAAHPYIATGWMRNIVWPLLGFDDCRFLDDFPQADNVRGLVSDQEVVDWIIETYQNRRNEAPLFYYAVTMQNHSGYNYQGPDFENSVHLAGYTKEYSDAEQYLSLLQRTDQAVENLITYFAAMDDPVVILFYGDHLPSLSQDFYNELHGGEFSVLDDQMKLYQVPFFIWCNYDIKEYEVKCTSLSYLSNYLYQVAGIHSAYSQFLSDMETHIPAINMLGYYSLSEACFLPFDQASGEEKVWLDKFRMLQYNALFDKENRSIIYSIN